jgi:hypothetical protein
MTTAFSAIALSMILAGSSSWPSLLRMGPILVGNDDERLRTEWNKKDCFWCWWRMEFWELEMNCLQGWLTELREHLCLVLTAMTWRNKFRLTTWQNCIAQ